MRSETASPIERIFTVLVVAAVFVGLYILWTHSTDSADLAVIAVTALIVSSLFVRARRFPRLGPKRVLYAIAYIPYLFVTIVQANYDVARRVVRRRIPINPGIVVVKTKLRSPL